MYEIFEKLLRERGVTAYKVAKETGIGTATLSNWKNGKYTPKQDKMQKIADFFGVTVDYLMTGKDTAISEVSILNNNSGVDDLSDDEKELIILYRKTGDIPEEEAEALRKQFESTIDIYLKAKGIKIDEDNK